MRTTSIILAAFLVTLALPVVAGAIYQAIGTWRDRWRFPPPGRLVRVNARRMHIHVTGKGTPAVVFESGMGASCLSWTLVQPHVAQFTRAISYDRAGHGWSDPAHEPRTAQQIAQELHTLLDAIGLPGPYVLVGHSFGGYVNRAFANMYRNEVVGMVLVDSVHPAEWEHPTPEQLRMIEVGLRYAWIAAWLARLGFVRFCLARLARGSPRLGQAAASTFGADTAAAVQRIAGEIRKVARTDPSNCARVVVAAKEFHEPGTARCRAAGQCCPGSGELAWGFASGRAFDRPSCGIVHRLATRPSAAFFTRATFGGEQQRTLDPSRPSRTGDPGYLRSGHGCPIQGADGSL